jgi:hypothetical protein
MEGCTSLFINFENTARKLYTHKEMSYAFSQFILLVFLVNIKYKIFDPIASSLLLEITTKLIFQIYIFLLTHTPF